MRHLHAPARVVTAGALVYPALHGRVDMGFARLNGAGLGNCLFTYCHAVVIAWQNQAPVIAPAWRTLALNAELRGRQFGSLIGPHPSELTGGRKALALARGRWRATRLSATAADAPQLGNGVTILTAPYVFDGLHAHRDPLRARFLQSIRSPAPRSWGRGAYIAMHVRLGDFQAASDTQVDLGDRANLRIPIAWYVAVASRLQRSLPDLPIVVFSNGTNAELAPLLHLNGVSRHPSASDLDDLLLMAQSRLLVGSHSTFSQWAAFLGNMPTIWRDRQTGSVQPTDDAKGQFYVDRALTGFPSSATLAGLL